MLSPTCLQAKKGAWPFVLPVWVQVLFKGTEGRDGNERAQMGFLKGAERLGCNRRAQRFFRRRTGVGMVKEGHR